MKSFSLSLFLSFSLSLLMVTSAHSFEFTDLKYGVGGGFITAGDMKGDMQDTTISTGDDLGKWETTFKEKAGVHLDFDARYTPENSWGGILGLSYEFKRKIKTIKYKDKDTGATVVDKPKNLSFQTTSLNANAVYRFSQFYIPFGISYNFIKGKNMDKEIGKNAKVDNSFGFQAGIGYYCTDFLVAELLMKTYTTKIEYADDDPFVDTSSKTTDSFRRTSAKLSVKYLF